MQYCTRHSLLGGQTSSVLPTKTTTQNTEEPETTLGGDGYVCHLDCGDDSTGVHTSKLYTSKRPVFCWGGEG